MQKAEKTHLTKLKELGLHPLAIGDSVRIKTYAELAALHGESFLVMDENDEVVIVDSSEDPDALGFIKALGYSKLTGDYYDNKTAVVDYIDILTGNLVLNIAGATTHNKFMDDGSVQSDTENTIVFTINHITKD